MDPGRMRWRLADDLYQQHDALSREATALTPQGKGAAEPEKASLAAATQVRKLGCPGRL
jgi:hypothetical protein